MKAPWSNKTGLSKWVAIFATTLGVATGLCGLNFMSFMLVGGSGGTSSKWDRFSENFGTFLIVAAYVEVFVMIVSAGALFALAVLMIVRGLMRKGD